ncbi:MAG: hypothetical protein Q8S22_07595, partial [Eubacteriales bacterium]|nr:hypothetical protein [Eubacteriales bacterium]
ALDNTMRTAIGFSKTVSRGVEDADVLLRSFCLAAVMQSAFLRKDVLKESIGIDWNDAQQRENFLMRVSGWLMSWQTSGNSSK